MAHYLFRHAHVLGHDAVWQKPHLKGRGDPDRRPKLFLRLR